MPDVLPNIPQEPAQGIQALLDTVYLWNPDVANGLIDKVNELLEELGDLTNMGAIKPYSELVAPVPQYLPMSYGDGVYVANEELSELPATPDLTKWTLIATKVDQGAIETQIQAEEDARIAEDAVLQGNIDSEASARAQADTALGNRITAEETARSGADSNLQQQIDAITASSDVKDIVGTHAELEDYDTSTLGDNDIIKVLQDETEEGATTYYRWVAADQEFSLIGEEGPYYTKTQTDTLLEQKQDTLTAGTGISITNNEISVTDPVLVNKEPTKGLITNSGTGTNVFIGWDNPGSGYVYPANSVVVGKTAEGTSRSISIGYDAHGGSDDTVAIGYKSNTDYSAVGSITIGAYSHGSYTKGRAIAIGYRAAATAHNAIQLGSVSASAGATNSDANTFKVANENGNFEIMSADGTIPADRLTHAINKYSSMPTASASNEGWIVQFTGTTDSTYTHGYLYECKAQGTDPETYAWEQVDVQPAGSSLPDQTGQSGKFLKTNGTSASWALALANSSLVGTSIQISNLVGGSTYGVCVGNQANATASYHVVIGYSATASGQGGIAIGASTTVSATGAIQLNSSGSAVTNSDANTFKVANANGNFEMMSADGTIPTARLTKVNTTATLAVADWSSSTQTVTVSGVAADSVVFVSPAPASASDYASAGILCTAQAADSLTFTCTTTPSNAITVNVICL